MFLRVNRKFWEDNLVVALCHRASMYGFWNRYCALRMNGSLWLFLCFLQAQLQMLYDSHTSGWPSFWPLQYAYCPSWPSGSCQWPFGHQKVIRYRKNCLSPNWVSLIEIKRAFPKSSFPAKSQARGKSSMNFYDYYFLSFHLASLGWSFLFLFFYYKNYQTSRGRIIYSPHISILSI